MQLKKLYYRLPDGEACYVCTPSDTGLSQFVVHPFELTDSSLTQAVDTSRFRLRKRSFVAHDRRLTSNSGHEQAVATAVQHIQNSALEKVVLHQQLTIDEVIDAQKSFEAACETYPSAFVYLLECTDGTSWIGASPETLAAWDGSHFVTMSLAGTRVAGSNTAWTDKEYREQQTVTDAIVARLGQAVSDAAVTVGEVNTITAGSLEHLHTEVRMAVTDRELALALAQSLHPTPAVCGQPRHLAQEQIAQLEDKPRELYTGYLGFVNKDSFRLFVNLRCAKIEASQTTIYVGGGINALSDPTAEVQETLNKAQTMSRILHPFGTE